MLGTTSPLPCTFILDEAGPVVKLVLRALRQELGAVRLMPTEAERSRLFSILKVQ
jgi:hypothetical protein